MNCTWIYSNRQCLLGTSKYFWANTMAFLVKSVVRLQRLVRWQVVHVHNEGRILSSVRDAVRSTAGRQFRRRLVGWVNRWGETLVAGRSISSQAVLLSQQVRIWLEERIVRRRLIANRQWEHFGLIVGGRRSLIGDGDRVYVAREKRIDKWLAVRTSFWYISKRTPFNTEEGSGENREREKGS